MLAQKKVIEGESNPVITHYVGDLENLRLKVGKNTIRLQNSLHKFLNQNNYTDFTLENVKESIQKISSLTSIDWSQASVKAMEYGININYTTDLFPEDFIRDRDKPFLIESRKGKIWGTSCFRNDYSLKFYNKTLEYELHRREQIPKNIYRWEVVVKNMRWIRETMNIPIMILQDLYKYENAQFILHDLESKFKKCIKKRIVNLEHASAGEIRSFSVIQNSEASKAMKLFHKRSFRENDSKKYNSLLAKSCSDKYQLFEEAIREKCIVLLNS